MKNKPWGSVEITEDDLLLPFNDFADMVLDVYDVKTFKKIFPVKLRIDSKNTLLDINGNGEIVIDNQTFSYSTIICHEKSNVGNYSISKVNHESDYFLLCFISLNAKTKFYFVPRKSLIGNSALHFNSHGVATVEEDDLNWLFKKNNLMVGTSYMSILTLLRNADDVVVKKDRNVARIKLIYKNKVTYIQGHTHSKLMENFINIIKPDFAINYIPLSYFHVEPSKYRKIKMGRYYLHTIFSIRDMDKVMQSFNRKQNIYHATLEIYY